MRLNAAFCGNELILTSLHLCFIQSQHVTTKSCYLTLSQTSPGFYVSAVQIFRKHCGKRRNCSQRAISPFPTAFSTLLENLLPFSPILNCRLQTLPIWKSKKFVFWERVNNLGKDPLKTLWKKKKMPPFCTISFLLYQ